MSGKKRKKQRGHYCWCCDTTQPNEQFSGKGHRRHLCRQCLKLGPKELKVRQALRDMEQCVDFDGQIYRSKRRHFKTFLRHPNPRVRAAAEEIVNERNRLEQEWRRWEYEYQMESFGSLNEIVQELQWEQAAVNRELAEAAEIDNCLHHIKLHI